MPKPAQGKFTLLNTNTRSTLNKVQPFESQLLDRLPDIVAVTKTWLSAPVSSHEVAPPNYILNRKDRQSGGGVALAIKKSIPPVILPEVADTEAVFCKIYQKHKYSYWLNLLKPLMQARMHNCHTRIFAATCRRVLCYCYGSFLP